MTSYTATYSPDDDKLRLYASSRLDAELARVDTREIAAAAMKSILAVCRPE